MRRSKILRLPQDVRRRLEQLLIDRGFADYAGLADWLQEQGHDVGRMSIQRYGSELEKRIESVRLSTEMANALIEASPDDAGATAEASLRLVQERIFDLLLKAEEGDLKGIVSAARAIAELARASVTVRQERRKVMAEINRALDEEAKRQQKLPPATPEQMAAAFRKALSEAA